MADQRGRNPASKRIANRDFRIEQHGPWSGSGCVFTACRIAQEFAHGVPTWQQLRDRFGMSRATAYRWLAAIKAARGVV